jgi:hypothetical protein
VDALRHLGERVRATELVDHEHAIRRLARGRFDRERFVERHAVRCASA